MSSDLAVGAIFAGRYRVEHRIASGGMGAVYEVVHLETNRRRALKVMHANFLQSEDLRGRFRQEARVAAEIESEYIVDVFDAGIDEATGMPFLVMELLRGEELGKRLRRAGPLPPAEVLLYLHQTSLALDKTHRAHIVHRDLKPDNLFLCEREEGPARIKVLDFGIAKIVAAGATGAGATQSLGTPLYMAPEQFLMDSSVSPATDIFALGMITFTLLVGKPYWYEESRGGGNVFAFAAHAALGPREPASARAHRLGASLPPTFDAWFARATAKTPAERFPSATSAVKALAEALGLAQPGLLGSGILPPGAISRPAFGSYSSDGGMGSLDTQATVQMAPRRTPMGSGAEIGVMTPAGQTPAGQAGTPMGPVMTPLGTGMTAVPTGRRAPTGLIAAGAGLVCLLVAVIAFVALRSGGEEKAPAAAVESARPVETNTAPAVVPAAPVETATPTAAAEASAAPVASAAATAKTAATTTKEPAKATGASTAKTPKPKTTWSRD